MVTWTTGSSLFQTHGVNPDMVSTFAPDFLTYVHIFTCECENRHFSDNNLSISFLRLTVFSTLFFCSHMLRRSAFLYISSSQKHSVLFFNSEEALSVLSL